MCASCGAQLWPRSFTISTEIGYGEAYQETPRGRWIVTLPNGGDNIKSPPRGGIKALQGRIKRALKGERPMFGPLEFR